MKTVKTIILILVLSCLLGCEQLKLDNYTTGDRFETIDLATTNSNLAEVTAPKIIRQLNQELEQYSPQVRITAPRAGKTFNQTDVAIKLAVEDLPIFQDDRLHLGNHLNLIVDNEPFQSIYGVDEPIIIKNLAPGTHTIRVFAVSPWGESFKNEGAYAQTTFNVLTETNANRPNADLPLLTYNSPNGTYGAEPVLLDFYLNNPDLPLAKNQPDNQKLLVKATINGTSLLIEDWQPYYLTGFEPGENWIQLELIDELGNTIENTFNNTVRVFTYNPQQQDNLAQLVSNKISFDDAQSIVKQSYYIQPEGTPEIIDFEDSAKPEIIPSELETIPEQSPEVAPEITNQANKPKESEISTTQAQRISPAESPIQPSNPQTKVLNEVSDAETETTTDTDMIVKTETDSDSLDLDSKVAATQVKPKPSVSKILITESNSPEETVAEIIVPQSKSIEIAESDIESDIAIAIPTAQPDDNSSESESTSVKFLWWKKILVGVRQTIEALARQLPSEV
ncbi:MAG: hypothetical protein RLZZ535_1446 [Cyanobacteriota bacterium]